MASGPEVERLTVTLELDYKQYLQDVENAVKKALDELKKVEESPKTQRTSWEQFSSFLSTKFLSVISSIGAAIAVAFSVQSVVNFFKTIAGGMIDTNKQFETFTTQFETLLGTTSEAKKRIDELAQFGQKTPFELDEIVEADRLLQTFGGTALATGENLRRIGDSAAAVNANFKEVSFWTGRLYSAIQAGRPFGEASARLQELGILTGDVRTKLEDMQKAGAKGTEIWAAYASMVDERFTGAMDRLSKTLSGVMSNLADFQSMLLRKGGEDLFEGVREDVIEFYDIISNPEAEEALVNLSKAFGSVLAALREAATTSFLEQFRDLDPAQIEHLSASIQDIGEAIGGITGIEVTSLGDLVSALDDLAQETATLIQALSALKDIITIIDPGIFGLSQRLDDMGSAGEGIKKALLGVLNPLYGVTSAFGDMNSEIEKLTGYSVSEWIGNVEEPAMAASSSLDAMGFAADGVAENMRGAAQATEEAAEDFTKAREKFEDLSRSFLDTQAAIDEQRQELEEDHGEKVADIVEDHGEKVVELEEEIADRRAEIIKDSTQALTDLEEEGAKAREEIAENTADALRKLEQETADAKADAIASAGEQLAELEEESGSAAEKIREEAQDEERRATEDHQREMRRLQQDYLLNLEDAVKSRDARAIVDLRRKYQQEKREKEEDFSVDRSRAREDAEKRVEEAREAEEQKRREIEEALEQQLEDIEESEAEKRAAIEEGQQEQLAQLEESEAEKREQIAASQEEQLAKLAETEAQKRAAIEESLAEQLAKEQESYAERQASLDEALQKKLEAIAVALAHENEITEAGAAAVLETLNEYYGVGGEMDQLMEAYLQRKAEMEASATSFDSNLPGGGPGGGEFVPAGSGGGSGLPAFAQGGIVPGRPGQKRLIIAHAGELVIPPDQTSRWMSQQGDMMAENMSGGQAGPMVVELKVSGSAPPGIGGSEIEQLAGMMVEAFNEAGIRTRQR